MIIAEGDEKVHVIVQSENTKLFGTKFKIICFQNR